MIERLSVTPIRGMFSIGVFLEEQYKRLVTVHRFGKQDWDF